MRLGMAFYMGDQVRAMLPGINDEITYHSLALSLLAGKGYQFEAGWYPFTPADTPTAHWSFLYPAYLAAAYGIFGTHPLVARLLQAMIGGVLIPLLAYRLGSRFFGNKVGLWAAGATAFYGYFIYHNAAMMTETFYMIAVLWVLDLAYYMIESGDDRRWPLLGVGMGTAVLLRQAYLFFIPILLIWIGWAARRRSMHHRLLLAFAIVPLCILPFTIRNYVQYGQLLLLNSNSGYALYTSNSPVHGARWDPDYIAPIPADLTGSNEAEMDRAFSSRGMRFVVTDPVRYVRLTLTKIPFHFRFWPTAESGLTSNIMRLISFGLFAPFMLVGLVLSRREWRRFLPIYAFAVTFTALHVLTWPGPRYRLPVDAVMMPFTGFALAWITAQLVKVLRLARQTPSPHGKRVNTDNYMSQEQVGALPRQRHASETLSVIIPVYNERKTLQEIVGRVLGVKLDGMEKELILVDDGSQDGSDEVLKDLACQYPDRIKVIVHDSNRGKGAAVRTGIAHASGELIIIQDADLEYSPSDFALLAHPILEGSADVVYGSRFQGQHRDFGLLHRVGNHLLTWATNLLYDTALTDMETCYKMFPANILKTLPLHADRFDIEPEITARILKGGYRVIEVPISYVGRSHSQGKKIRAWRDGWSALWTLVRLRFSD